MNVVGIRLLPSGSRPALSLKMKMESSLNRRCVGRRVG
jgi:hypothetical protein